jgi:hypothetical protein
MMLAETATEYIRILYSVEVFTIIAVRAGRAISSKAESRGKLTELLVVNCPVDRVVQLGLFCEEQASRHRGNSISFHLSGANSSRFAL